MLLNVAADMLLDVLGCARLLCDLFDGCCLLPLAVPSPSSHALGTVWWLWRECPACKGPCDGSLGRLGTLEEKNTIVFCGGNLCSICRYPVVMSNEQTEQASTVVPLISQLSGRDRTQLAEAAATMEAVT